MNLVVILGIAATACLPINENKLSMTSATAVYGKSFVLADKNLPDNPYGSNPHGADPHGVDPHYRNNHNPYDENHDLDLPANDQELQRKSPDLNDNENQE